MVNSRLYDSYAATKLYLAKLCMAFAGDEDAHIYSEYYVFALHSFSFIRGQASHYAFIDNIISSREAFAAQNIAI